MENMLQTVVWSNWLERNRRTFEEIEESVDELWIRIKTRAAWWISNHKSFRVFFFSDIIRDLSILL